MIRRVYLESCLSFEHVDLEFEKGLMVFTGPSGAGKSILMDAFLSLFAYKEVKANLAEMVIENAPFAYESFMIEKGDDIILKAHKKDKVRYFLNNQSISKRNLLQFATQIVKFLHLKDTSDFQSSKLIAFLDKFLQAKDESYEALLKEFKTTFEHLTNTTQALEKIMEDENKIEELKEFARFEIEKIALLDPKVDEYEHLNHIKKSLSKKEKIEACIEKASGIFAFQSSVSEALELLEIEGAFFDEAMNELNNQFERFSDSLHELEEMDIETILDRIEKLSSLQKRFGSIEQALEYKEQKQEELKSYENISFEKNQLQKEQQQAQEKIDTLAATLTNKRQEAIKWLQVRVNEYLKQLYLNEVNIQLHNKVLDSTGKDSVAFLLNGVDLQTISSGEFNRLRLALLTAMSEFEIVHNGILFLDEIDANVSGKESSAIATVLKTLSKSYQIFAISHQPQLTAAADIHFLVDKKGNHSCVKSLNNEEKINEIARMISGENITSEAKSFAHNLLQS
jgi:DNA repair protein RecN (Recombination protein N)